MPEPVSAAAVLFSAKILIEIFFVASTIILAASTTHFYPHASLHAIGTVQSLTFQTFQPLNLSLGPSPFTDVASDVAVTNDDDLLFVLAETTNILPLYNHLGTPSRDRRKHV
jgi:hypothetical protein